MEVGLWDREGKGGENKHRATRRQRPRQIQKEGMERRTDLHALGELQDTLDDLEDSGSGVLLRPGNSFTGHRGVQLALQAEDFLIPDGRAERLCLRELSMRFRQTRYDQQTDTRGRPQMSSSTEDRTDQSLQGLREGSSIPDSFLSRHGEQLLEHRRRQDPRERRRQIRLQQRDPKRRVRRGSQQLVRRLSQVERQPQSSVRS